MGKKQHYVPKMILKRFSQDIEHKMINLFIINNKRIVENAALKNQACGHYIYGADQILENFYGDVEGNTDYIVEKLNNKEMEINYEEKFIIKLFINLQYFRTKHAKNNANEMLDKMIKELTKNDAKMKKFRNSVKAKYTDPFMFLFPIALETTKYIIDLKLRLIENRTDIPFIIGEHPVVILNPFLIERKWIGSKDGLAVKGTIIYFPISPTIGIILFDGDKYKTHKLKKIPQVTVDDVHKLNKCQFALTEDCIYFNENYSNIPFNDYLVETEKYRRNDKTTLDVYVENISKKKMKKKGYSELLVSGKKDLPINQKFSFIHMTYNSIFEDLGRSMDIRRESVKVLENSV